MALYMINLPKGLAQGWNGGLGPIPYNASNPVLQIPGTDDDNAYVVNTAMIDFTNYAAGTPANHRETISAIVWGTGGTVNPDEIYLYIEHTVRDLTSFTPCNTIVAYSLQTTNLTIGAQGLHPDVIIRDHPNNPGVEYIVSVVYSENGAITLEEFAISGLVHGGPSSITLAQINKSLITTATYTAGTYGAYPKIDGFVNPAHIIGAYPEMAGFAVTWETSQGVELQVFDANATPFYETLITVPAPFPSSYTPDVAAVVEWDATISAYRQYAYVVYHSYWSILGSGDFEVQEFDITSSVTTPLTVTQLSAGASGYSHSRIDAMGEAVYPNARWVVIASSDCNGGWVFSNTVNPFGQYLMCNPNGASLLPTLSCMFHSFTVTAGVGRLAGTDVMYEDGNFQYPFGMASGDNPPESFVFLNAVDANTSLAFNGTLPDFGLVNNPVAADEIPYVSCGLINGINDIYVGQGYSLSTSCNSGYDLIGAWVNISSINQGIQYKYTCVGDMSPFGAFSPLVGQLNNETVIDDIVVYPNPAEENLFIRVNDSIIPKVLSIYDVMGRVVLERNVAEDDRLMNIALPELTTGMYRIDITDIEGKRHGKTVMLKK